jgi:hypothetical protein
MVLPMAENIITSDGYLEFVVDTYDAQRLGKDKATRIKNLLSWLNSEVFETYETEERALALLAPLFDEEYKINDDLRTHLVSEWGDIMWFNFALAHEVGVEPHAAHAEHARLFGSRLSSAKLRYFQATSMRHMDQERLDTKPGHSVSFNENPFLHVVRLSGQLIKSYDSDYKPTGPWLASDSEAPKSNLEVMGFVSCTVAKASRFILDMSLGEVLRFNMAKAARRKAEGKTFDHPPDSLD